MIKFESNNIIVGYIKNILTEFKLPTPKIYTYGDNFKYAVPGKLYIKDDFVCKCDETRKFIPLFRFNEDSIAENYYKTLKFTGNSYDSHTHEYLGDYLRFLRDYKGINLMSLYNCYSNNFPKKVFLNITDDEDTSSNVNLYIDPKDPLYKIIMLPVKVDQPYTVAIDSQIPYDMFCGYYNRAFDTNKTQIVTKTYKKIGSSSFNKPFIYDSLLYENLLNKELPNDGLYQEATRREDDLKLFIKLPATNTSSIVILEGNYANNNDWYWGLSSDNTTIDIFNQKYNYSTLNFEPDFEDVKPNEEIPPVKYDSLVISNLQLLKINSEFSYPFADRLMEYLVENAITPIDSISDNIKRVQWLLLERYLNGKKSTGISSIGNHYGIWDDKYVAVLYKLAIEEGLINEKSDILGYVDKDIEAKIGKYVDIAEKEGN